METIKIDVYISDLFYSYDCVIVPNFGGFVANYSSAKLNSIQYKFQAPSKRISFNQQLQNNDGLLTNHIAGKKEISYAEAKKLVAVFVERSKKGLQEGDRIKIERIGTLFLDAEKNIQFIAENSTNYLLDSFGLEAFRTQPIKREKIEDRIVGKIKEKSPVLRQINQKEEAVSSSKKKKVRWIPAAAIFLLFILSVFILNLQYKIVDSSGINYSSFRLNSSEKMLYSSTTVHVEDFSLEEEIKAREPLFPADSLSQYITSINEETNLFVDNRNVKPELKKDNTLVQSSSQSDHLGLNFHVIAGCFAQSANATTLLEQLSQNGYEAVFLGPYKKYQAVSIGSFDNREKALTLLRSVRNNGHPNAWLLVKSY